MSCRIHDLPPGPRGGPGILGPWVLPEGTRNTGSALSVLLTLLRRGAASR